MYTCTECFRDYSKCRCDTDLQLDPVTEDLVELHESKKPGAKRCLICFNYVCRCGDGHAERLKRGG